MSEIYALGTFSKSNENVTWPGVVRDTRVLPLSTFLPEAPAELGKLFAAWDAWGERIDKALVAAPASNWLSEDELTIHLPYMPDNLFGAGANYRKHVIDLIVDKGHGGLADVDLEDRRRIASEMMDHRAATGKPYFFVAQRGVIIGPRDPFTIPYDVTEPDWECELAVVIGKTARRVSRENALEYVAGYTVANDLTARELVDRPDVPQMGMDWFACKGGPGFKVLGPYITPARFVPDPQKLRIRLSLNSQVMQHEGTDDMIFTVARLIEFASKHTCLFPGDMIMTGSPSGNGTHYGRFLQKGDVMVGEVEGLVGRQVTICKAEDH